MATLFSSTLTNNSKTQFTFACDGNALPDDVYINNVNTLTNLNTEEAFSVLVSSNSLNIPEFEQSTYTIQTTLPAIGLESWSDGVWNFSVQFFAEELEETYYTNAYALSLYDIECQMAKFGAKLACACSDNLVRQGCKILTYYDAINQTFNASDYNSTITLIKKLQNILTKEGCGCGC
jgi:hypothetical protein